MRLKKIHLILIILGILIIIVWGIYFYLKLFTTKKSPPSPYRTFKIEKIKMPYFEEIKSCGKSLKFDDLEAELNILIFFAFEDCSSCLYEAESWSLAAKMYLDEVKIIGIVNKYNEEYLAEFKKEYGISFPIICDDKDILKRKILNLKGIYKLGLITPFKVFINNKHIIHVEGPSKFRDQQARFPDRVINILYDIRGRKKR